MNPASDFSSRLARPFAPDADQITPAEAAGRGARAGRGVRSWSPTRRLAGLVALAVAAFTAGCQILPDAQPDPTRFFVLASPPPASASASAEPETGRLTIGLRPVELPAYLRNTRSLVVARGPYQLEYRDFDRWAEPLDASLSRVLRDGLAQADRVERVVTFPFAGEPPRDFEVVVRVHHCEGVAGRDGAGVVRLVLGYEILRPGAAGELVRQGNFVAPETLWDGEAETMAAQLSEAAAAAAAAIASALP